MQHLTQSELAKRWQLSPRTLERWRVKGCGPRFLKLGGRCMYPATEVESFEEARLRQKAGKKDHAEGEGT